MKFVFNKYFHGEKTSKHFDQYSSHDAKNTFYSGGFVKFTDTRF